MKKKIIIGSVIATALIGLAGCGGTGGDSKETTAAESTTAESTQTTATTAETTTSSATTEATATTTETDTTEATTSESRQSDGKITVKKVLDGYEKKDEYYFVSASSSDDYLYMYLDDATSHYIESELDGLASSLIDGDVGKEGDVLYAKGKQDNGTYVVTAYKYAGAGNSVSAYVGIQFISANETSASDVAKLLSDEYISVE